MSVFWKHDAARSLAIGAVFAALCLAGCGRKSGLDPPPAATVVDQSTAPAEAGKPQIGPDGRPVAPPPATRRTWLDWLID